MHVARFTNSHNENNFYRKLLNLEKETLFAKDQIRKQSNSIAYYEGCEYKNANIK